MNRGHVPAEVLASYADGSLADGMCLIVAGHLTFCPRCRDHLDRLEALGGALLTEPAPGCCAKPDLGKILSRIEQAETNPADRSPPNSDRPDPDQPDLDQSETSGADAERAGSERVGSERAEAERASAASPPATGCAAFDALPRCLRGRLGSAVSAPGWQALGEGVFVVDIPITGPGTLRLFHCDPGVALPEHEHRSPAAALILRGRLCEGVRGVGPGSGLSFGRGDLILSRPGERHAPVIDPDGPCLVLTLDEGGPLDIMPSGPSSPG
ncbi:hypothetical protein [Amaricoccus sp. W119]|uniref:hypothetical protein n=1 Tax=Amaricoccus sp. W119 TaxID=3391833 RepID=UPI0039A5AA4D